MNAGNKLVPVLYGTAIMVFINIMPVINLVNLFCCAGIVAGGFVGVFVYWRQIHNSGQFISAKDGGMIGILSGILSAVIITGFGILISLFSDKNPILDFLNVIDETGISIPDEMNVYLEKFSNEFNEHGFSPTITLLSFVSNIILFPLFGAIGALLGVSILNKKIQNPS